MPKAFSPKEKSAIRAQLLAIGQVHFTRLGIRGARIDDICREVGIAKGSFYAFYPSKEDLFMALADARDIDHKKDMLDFVDKANGEPKQSLGALFDFLMIRIDSDPILRIVRDQGELNYLVRKVSPSLLAENDRRDREFLTQLAARLHQRLSIKDATAEILEGLMSLMLCLGMQREIIAATGAYQRTVALMRGLFIDRLLHGKRND